MKITRQEDYALTVSSALAENFRRGFTSLNQIANQYRLPKPFLKKIAGQLKRAGLVKVREGRNGGYRLTRSPQKISAEEILRVFNPQILVTKCLSENEKILCARYATCQARQTWQAISQQFYANLKKINLVQISNLK
ncbi:MAG: Rrf2 family transcriptional regulator [Patescibacteria group bacterium]